MQIKIVIGCVVALRKESVDRNIFGRLGGRAGGPSLSARRAWIEISCIIALPPVLSVALRKESVDRNPKSRGCLPWLPVSLSARRAWIEISNACRGTPMRPVALRKESVDRNQHEEGSWYTGQAVALRKESVDRNDEWIKALPGYWVALRKESVDRNRIPGGNTVGSIGSLSARRAWIEILIPVCPGSGCGESLSARRAWIEIRWCQGNDQCQRRRSPQGERG